MFLKTHVVVVNKKYETYPTRQSIFSSRDFADVVLANFLNSTLFSLFFSICYIIGFYRHTVPAL